jgi:gas vesicle protein
MKITKFGLGVCTGVILGVLFAPAQGYKSRKTVANAAGKVNAQFKKWFSNEAKELDELKALLEDETLTLNENDRKRLVQLIENNKRVLKELDV